MKPNVGLLVLLFLNFGLILAEEPPQVGYVKESRKLEESCSFPQPEKDEGMVQDCNICQDHHLEKLRQMICSCHGSRSEGTEDGDQQTIKAKNNDKKSYILMLFDLLKDLYYILETFMKVIAIFIFILHHLIHELATKLFFILAWILWFLQIIISTIFKIFFSIVLAIFV